MAAIQYTDLELPRVADALSDIARDAETTFGSLDEGSLNWVPAPKQWSVAHCFRHLVTANELMVKAARIAIERPPSSIWQRIPVLPGKFGPALIRSQAPESTKKYKAPHRARPTASAISPDIIRQFSEQARAIEGWCRTLDGEQVKRIMVSPFIGFIAYSVLDGFRLMVAHDHRHFEQARRVTERPNFGKL